MYARFSILFIFLTNHHSVYIHIRICIIEKMVNSDTSAQQEFSTKKELYKWLLNEVPLLVESMPTKFTPAANMLIALSNVSALLFYTLNHFHDPNAKLDSVPVNWLGFYLLQAPGTLGLGPFQGRPACMTIRVGRGVCGTAAEQKKSIIVSDVHSFPGHIACDSASNSEIVVPIISSQGGGLLGVIDVDSIRIGLFDEEDQEGLEAIATILTQQVSFFPMRKVLTIQPSFDKPEAADVPPYLLPNYSFGPSHPHSMVGFSSQPIPPTDCPTATAETEKDAEKGVDKYIVTPLPTKIPAFSIKEGHVLQSNSSVSSHILPSSTQKNALLSTKEKTVAGWCFRSLETSCIANDAELNKLSKETKINYLPEILYLNGLEVIKCDPYPLPVLRFDIVSLVQNAKMFYRSNFYNCSVKDSFRVAAYQKWLSNPYPVMDAGIDWAWRNDFFGLAESYPSAFMGTAWSLGKQEGEENARNSQNPSKSTPPPPSTPYSFGLVPITSEMEKEYRINWELLRDQTEPILFSAAHTLFEDDLHDNGNAQCTVKIRVLHRAFFILFRYVLDLHDISQQENEKSNSEIEGHIAPDSGEKKGLSAGGNITDEENGRPITKGIARDVRVFHEFDKKLPNKNFPMIIVQEKLTKLSPSFSTAKQMNSSKSATVGPSSKKFIETNSSPLTLEQRIEKGSTCYTRHFYVTTDAVPPLAQ